MKKGNATRKDIIEKAAILFNKSGYAGGSLSGLMKATGLKKGGIYNHFSSKDEIALEAFNWSIGQLNKTIYQYMAVGQTVIEQLKRMARFFEEYPLNPVIEGGCPFLNMVIDADNTHSVIQRRSKEYVGRYVQNLTNLIEKGKISGEIKDEVNAEEAAIIIISMIQGAIFLGRGMKSNHYTQVISRQVNNYICDTLEK